MLKVVKSSPDKLSNAVKLMLLSKFKDSYIPELYEVFGEQQIFRFLDIFAGTTIRVPRARDLQNAIRDSNVYVLMSGKDQAAAKDILMKRYSMSSAQVDEVYKEVKQVFVNAKKNKKNNKV